MVPSFIPKDERHSVDLPRRQPPAPVMPVKASSNSVFFPY